MSTCYLLVIFDTQKLVIERWLLASSRVVSLVGLHHRTQFLVAEHQGLNYTEARKHMLVRLVKEPALQWLKHPSIRQPSQSANG